MSLLSAVIGLQIVLSFITPAAMACQPKGCVDPHPIPPIVVPCHTKCITAAMLDLATNEIQSQSDSLVSVVGVQLELQDTGAERVEYHGTLQLQFGQLSSLNVKYV